METLVPPLPMFFPSSTASQTKPPLGLLRETQASFLTTLIELFRNVTSSLDGSNVQLVLRTIVLSNSKRNH